MFMSLHPFQIDAVVSVSERNLKELIVRNWHALGDEFYIQRIGFQFEGNIEERGRALKGLIRVSRIFYIIPR